MILLWCLLLGALAGPQPFYEDQGHVLELKLKSLNRKSLRQLVTQQSDGRIKRFLRQNSEGTRVPTRLAQFDEVELLGLVTILLANNPGAEMDVILEDFQGRRVPVSLWWDRADELVVHRGQSVVVDIDWTLTVDGLQASFGIADVRRGDTAWEPAALQLVAGALETLSPGELARVRDVPIVRMSEPSDEIRARLGREIGQEPVAVYTQDRSGPRIELYDGALRPPRRFVGSPDAPKPLALHVLLHEIGHAVSRYEHRQVYRRDLRLVAEHNRLTDEVNARGAAYTARAKAYRRRPSRSESAALSSEIAWLDGQKEKIEGLSRQIERTRVELAKLSVSAAAKGLRRALRGKPAPTRYGQTSLEEGFAECFALYHGDRPALLRARPSVHDWFEQAGHLPEG